jgi:hypothetical protein
LHVDISGSNLECLNFLVHNRSCLIQFLQIWNFIYLIVVFFIYLFIFNAFGFFHVPTNSPSLHSPKQPKIEEKIVLKIFIKQDFDDNDFFWGDIFFHHQEPTNLSPYITPQRTKIIILLHHTSKFIDVITNCFNLKAMDHITSKHNNSWLCIIVIIPFTLHIAKPYQNNH